MALAAHRRVLMVEKSLYHEGLCIGHDPQTYLYHCHLSKAYIKSGQPKHPKNLYGSLFPKLNELVGKLFVFNTREFMTNAEIRNLCISF